MVNQLLDHAEKSSLKATPPAFEVGDTVDVATRIVEGDKERVQVFSGVVLMKKGRGVNSMFTVRRIVNNEGVERIFPLHSPLIASVTVKRSARVRRAKLFYLRTRVGKATRLVEKRKAKKEPAAAAEQPAAAAPELAGATA